jgi:hypothetical protein
MRLNSISIHPKLAAILDLFFGGIFLFLLPRVSVWWILVILVVARILVWFVLVRLSYYPTEIKRFWHLLTLIVFHLGITILLLFIEWNITWQLVGFIYLLFPIISFYLLPARRQNLLSFAQKPYRRWRFWCSVAGLYGILVGTFASISLQIFNISNLWILFLSTVLSGLLSAWWWYEYGVERNKKFWWWMLIISLFVFEIAWVLYLWPLGYFVSALVLLWLWYDIWLMGRFHLLPSGINWKKQISFFIINGLLLAIFLFLIVKWR